jgi:HEPN domain-containing protein
MKIEKRIDIWVQQAAHDLEAAEKNLRMSIYDYCLIGCEQAVEKILKAFYLKITGKEPPHIHVLEELVEKVDLQNELADLIVELDDYYFLVRYPGFSDEVPYQQCSEEDAKSGLEKTKKIFNIIQQKLKATEQEEEQNEPKQS